MTTCVVLASADSNDIAGKRICIDPGHGGSDPGATSNGLKEKDVNLNVALRLKELLVSKGAIPVLTREDDSKPSHPKRWKIANDNNCEIFIAIHCNANQKTAPSGTEVYYYPKDIPTNTLAQKVYENVVSYLETKGDRSGPIKYAQGTNSYGVLGAAYNGGKQIPAINVELAFISNPGDNKKLASPEYQQKAANAILNGLQSLSINSAPPGLPTSLTQYKSDGVTGITVGGTTTESTVIMKGGVSDPSGNTVKLEVEVEPVGSPSFTGIPTSSSALVASGSTASVPVTGLTNGQYKWQARATNSKGVSGSWQAAGGNADSAPDFVVSVAPVTLTVSPPSGRQGTTFTFSGNGYTHNEAIEYHVRKPDNTEYPVTTLTASSSGVLSYSYRSTTASPVGTYTIWAIDKKTGRQSNNVQETIDRTSRHLK